MSRSELHDWEYAIKKLSGNNADKMLDIAQDIYNTAFVRGRNSMTWEQEPCEDVMTIHTQGLDEEIRCIMCTNPMRSDRGCDGGCMVDKDMYEKVMDVIRNRIVSSVTPASYIATVKFSRKDLQEIVDKKQRIDIDINDTPF